EVYPTHHPEGADLSRDLNLASVGSSAGGQLLGSLGEQLPGRRLILRSLLIAAEVGQAGLPQPFLPLALALPPGLGEHRVHGAGELEEEGQRVGQFALVEVELEAPLAGAM